LSVNDPNGSVTPNNTKELSDLCVKLEREILLNALGLSLYNEVKALTDLLMSLQTESLKN
jgi:hypothetical protein